MTSENGAAAIGNGKFDPTKTKEFVSRIESLHGDLLSERGSYMQTCKGIRDDIAIVLDEAKEAGIPKKELRKVIKARELERKANEIRDDLESDEQDNFDLIRQALGDLDGTPLGQAALAKPKGKRGRPRKQAPAPQEQQQAEEPRTADPDDGLPEKVPQFVNR